MLQLPHPLSNTRILKIASLFIGILLWSILSDLHVSSVRIRVPLYFYTTDGSSVTVKAPEEITVVIAAKRWQLRLIDFNTLALHVDVTEKSQGSFPLKPTIQQLFLPSYLKLVSYEPINSSFHSAK
jgi:hypothetical protein